MAGLLFLWVILGIMIHRWRKRAGLNKPSSYGGFRRAEILVQIVIVGVLFSSCGVARILPEREMPDVVSRTEGIIWTNPDEVFRFALGRPTRTIGGNYRVDSLSVQAVHEAGRTSDGAYDLVIVETRPEAMANLLGSSNWEAEIDQDLPVGPEISFWVEARLQGDPATLQGKILSFFVTGRVSYPAPSGVSGMLFKGPGSVEKVGLPIARYLRIYVPTAEDVLAKKESEGYDLGFMLAVFCWVFALAVFLPVSIRWPWVKPTEAEADRSTG
jgi:hypothetical protein